MKKVLLWVVGILLGLFVISFFLPDVPKSVTNSTKENIDSLVAMIEKIMLGSIQEVFYNPKDSMLNIAFSNPSHLDKAFFTTAHFNNAYHLNDYSSIEGTRLFEYKKGKYLKNGDYKEPLTADSKALGRKYEEFKKKIITDTRVMYLSPYIFEILCMIHQVLSLLRLMKATPKYGWYVSLQGKFRAKNGFGALTLHLIECDIDMNGNVNGAKVI